jgi:NADPH2:quinone reductase
MVNYGAASGQVPPIDPMVLMEKGSIYLSRPSLQHYAALRTELEERSSAVFGMIAAGKLKLRIEHRYPLAEAVQAHRDLESRKTTGKLLLLT